MAVRTTYEPVEASVLCSGKRHRVRLTRRGAFILLDHDGESLAAEKVLLAMGGRPCRCVEVREAWHRVLNMPLVALRRRGCMIAQKQKLPRVFVAAARHAAWVQHRRREASEWLDHGGVMQEYDNEDNRLEEAKRAVRGAFYSATYGSGRVKSMHVYRASDKDDTRLEGKMIARLDHRNRFKLNVRAHIHPPAVLAAKRLLGTLVARHGNRRVMILGLEHQVADSAFYALAGQQTGRSRDYDANDVKVALRRCVIELGTTTARYSGRKLHVWRVTKWL